MGYLRWCYRQECPMMSTSEDIFRHLIKQDLKLRQLIRDVRTLLAVNEVTRAVAAVAGESCRKQRVYS